MPAPPTLIQLFLTYTFFSSFYRWGSGSLSSSPGVVQLGWRGNGIWRVMSHSVAHILHHCSPSILGRPSSRPQDGGASSPWRPRYRITGRGRGQRTGDRATGVSAFLHSPPHPTLLRVWNVRDGQQWEETGHRCGGPEGGDRGPHTGCSRVPRASPWGEEGERGKGVLGQMAA